MIKIYENLEEKIQGDTILIPAILKHIRTGLKSRDQICVTVDGHELWIDIEKSRKEKYEQSV